MSLEQIIAAVLPLRAQLVAHVILDLINNNYGLNPVYINTQGFTVHFADFYTKSASHSYVICPGTTHNRGRKVPWQTVKIIFGKRKYLGYH